MRDAELRLLPCDPELWLRRSVFEQSPQAEGALHRLRREGSVQLALRSPQVRAAAERAWHRASLRGVPRQPYRGRLSDGRELAFSRPGAIRLNVDGPRAARRSSQPRVTAPPGR